MPATMADNTDNEQMLLEGVVYYVDPKFVGTLAFLGGKGRIRIPITSTHSSLEALRRHIIEHAGLKAESEKRGLGSCIELKLCQLAKSAEGSKAYAINTQAQWDEERPLFLKSPSTTALQGEQLVLIFARVCEWSLKDAIAKASDSILVCASDVEGTISDTITLELNGMAVEGNVAFFSKYPNSCEEAISMCVSSNVLYLSHKGEPGGVVAITMSDLTVEMVVKNGSAHCVESSHVTAYRNGIIYTEGRQIKVKIPGEEVTVIAGSGMEGNCNGRAKDASFSQPMGICVELDRNIFVTDAQAGSVKLITTIKGTAEFLKHLGMLYKAFSIHQKHQVVAKISLADAIELLKVLDSYLKRSTDEVISTFDKPCKPMGAKGTISSQTQSSVSMILKQERMKVPSSSLGLKVFKISQSC